MGSEAQKSRAGRWAQAQRVLSQAGPGRVELPGKGVEMPDRMVRGVGCVLLVTNPSHLHLHAHPGVVASAGCLQLGWTREGRNRPLGCGGRGKAEASFC